MKYNLIGLATVFTLLVAVVLCYQPLYGQQIQHAKQPNIIFMMADDLGIGDLGVYGQTKIETPHIDRLAKEGMKFSQFYSGTSVCAPSRSSLMTGLHTGHTPVRGNFEIEPEGQMPLPDSTFTIPKMLKAAGYKTALFGKWGLGMNATTGDPNTMGFDEAYGYLCQRQAHNYFPDHIWENGSRIDLTNTAAHQEFYSAALFQKQAISFLEAQTNEQPFFMYVSFTLPHAALQVPDNDPYLAYYKKKFNEQPLSVRPWNGGPSYQPQPYPHSAYAAMVARMDAYVGEILAMVKKKGLEENTLIIFTSDNGAHVEGGNDPYFFNSNKGLRGIKRDLYEGGIMTPLLVKWKNHIKSNSKSTYLGAFWDFMPTFSEIAQANTLKYSDGISILPTLLGKKQKNKHSYLYWEFHEEGGRKALRMGDWKLIKYGVDIDENAPWLLYHLKDDPYEKHNVADKYPKIVAKMTAQITKVRTPASVKEWNFKFEDQ